MKVAVSVPDRVFDAAEQLAKARRVPRSQVFAEALVEYVAKHGNAGVTEKLDQVYGKGTPVVEPALASAQFAVSHREAW